MERLYNGIVLPDIWPPHYEYNPECEEMKIPYLENPPEIIDITVGRQLFVDDFLIESTNLERRWHSAVKDEKNPILYPETELEKGGGGYSHAEACPKSGGVWWDGREHIFKMWYEAGWYQALAYATSEDGIHWDRPLLNDGNNRILANIYPDSSTFFIDESSEEQRYKMFSHGPSGNYPGIVATSKDGIHWENLTFTGSGMGDRSTMFYNPFRKKWVFSIRTYREGNRTRDYYEFSDFLAEAPGSAEGQVYWMAADKRDEALPGIEFSPQCYNVDAVAYESIMVGLFQIFRGPENEWYQQKGIPKVTELIPMFSRDGFHFSRHSRKPLIAASREAGTWDRGYIQSVGGICVVVGEELWFYYIGLAGDEDNHFTKCWPANGMYANGATGIARLRRDGFASMETCGKNGYLLTRKFIFQDQKQGLYVNADMQQGALRCEIQDESGKAIPGFELENCIPMREDSVRRQIRWKNCRSIETLAGKVIRIRFCLENGALYSFWAGDSEGNSGGFLAAGEKK